MPYNTHKTTFPHPNGNITTQHRHNQSGNPIDQFSYKYLKDLDEKLYQNRLYAVIDDVPAIDFPDDIDGIDYAFVTDPALINTDNNYGYDQLGQLVRDDEESIEEIIWRIDGKISSILREDASGKSELNFVYDALGNRVAQKVYDDEGNWQKTTYYSRDAQGNVMAVYEYTEVESEPALNFSEVHKYGSSRLGIRIPQGTPDLIGATDPIDDETLSLERGNDRFELSNHLGNVLSIVSDRILPIENGNTGVVSHHRPEVLTVMDYYPFGAMMEGRSYTTPDEYRYGFNGKDHDESELQNYGYRNFSNELGRFVSIDPLSGQFPWYSTYQFAGNKPIQAIDLEGAEEFIRTRYFDVQGNLYRTEIQVIRQLDGSDSQSNGIGPIQYVHETTVTMLGNGNHAVAYAGTTIGQRINPDGANGLTAPGSDAFSQQENQLISNITPLGGDGMGGQISDVTRPYGQEQEIVRSREVTNANGRRVEVIDNKPLRWLAGHQGILVIQNAPTPANAGYFPIGFNVTPANPANRFSNNGRQYDRTKSISLKANLNMFAVAHKGETSERAPGTTINIPSRSAADNIPGPQIRTRQRTESVTF